MDKEIKLLYTYTEYNRDFTEVETIDFIIDCLNVENTIENRKQVKKVINPTS